MGVPFHRHSTKTAGGSFPPALLSERWIFTYGESQLFPKNLLELFTSVLCCWELQREFSNCTGFGFADGLYEDMEGVVRWGACHLTLTELEWIPVVANGN